MNLIEDISNKIKELNKYEILKKHYHNSFYNDCVKNKLKANSENCYLKIVFIAKCNLLLNIFYILQVYIILHICVQ